MEKKESLYFLLVIIFITGCKVSDQKVILGPDNLNDQMINGPFIGDWQDTEYNYVAQVIQIDDVNYRANIFQEFDTPAAPLAVLWGHESGDTSNCMLTLEGDGWSATIVNRRFRGLKGSESFDMTPVIRSSPTLSEVPPANAIILFDGSSIDKWAIHDENDWLTPISPANQWKILPGGIWEVVPGTGSIITKREFGDFYLHLEFRLLGVPTNSGIYLQTRYQVNIKDSYGQIGGNPCGTLENIAEPAELKPRLNMSLPPFQWQTFDIDFRAPRFENSDKVENAYITVLFNGVMIYEDVRPETLEGASKRFGEAPTGPIKLQEHDAPLQFRNIWIIDKSG